MSPQASAISEKSSLRLSAREVMPQSGLAGLQVLCHQMWSRTPFGAGSRLLGARHGCDCSAVPGTRAQGQWGYGVVGLQKKLSEAVNKINNTVL